jgi:NAD(P)H-dependent FMN reductase
VSQNAVEIRRHLNDSDGTIFVSPEWNGMMSHGILNMLHYIKDELAHKPVMLVGVSSGRGGAYPIEQMRKIGPKNRHYVISPENLIVSDVTRMLNDDQFSSENIDYQVKIRADYALQVLFEYAHALAQVRTSDVIDLTSFSSGV